MKLTPLLAALALVWSASASAGPAAQVYTPTVEFGETELELRYGTTREPDEAREHSAVLAVAYGVTQRWKTELEAEFEREHGHGTRLEAIAWENIVLLTEPGEYAFDVGLLVEIERPMEHEEGWVVEFGPLIQTEVGKVQLNFNPLFERHFRSEEDSETELSYQWQVKVRHAQAFEFGLQGFGEVGEWNDWEDSEDQEHMAGPAVFG